MKCRSFLNWANWMTPTCVCLGGRCHCLARRRRRWPHRRRGLRRKRRTSSICSTTRTDGCRRRLSPPTLPCCALVSGRWWSSAITRLTYIRWTSPGGFNSWRMSPSRGFQPTGGKSPVVPGSPARWQTRWSGGWGTPSGMVIMSTVRLVKWRGNRFPRCLSRYPRSTGVFATRPVARWMIIFVAGRTFHNGPLARGSEKTTSTCRRLSAWPSGFTPAKRRRPTGRFAIM